MPPVVHTPLSRKYSTGVCHHTGETEIIRQTRSKFMCITVKIVRLQRCYRTRTRASQHDAFGIYPKFTAMPQKIRHRIGTILDGEMYSPFKLRDNGDPKRLYLDTFQPEPVIRSDSNETRIGHFPAIVDRHGVEIRPSDKPSPEQIDHTGISRKGFLGIVYGHINRARIPFRIRDYLLG